MDTIVAVRLAGTNLINIVSPLDGSHGRQASTLGSSLVQLIQEYMRGISSLSVTATTVDDIGMRAYIIAVFPMLVDYCAQNCKEDLYILEEVVDSTGQSHAVPMILQCRSAFQPLINTMTGFHHQQGSDNAITTSKLVPKPRAAMQLKVKDTILELNIFIVKASLVSITNLLKTGLVDLVNAYTEQLELDWMMIGSDISDELPELIMSRRDARNANNGYPVEPTPPPLPMVNVDMVDSAGKLQTICIVIDTRLSMSHKTGSLYDTYW